MKANELMIGDWVLTDMLEQMQVCEIHEDEVMLDYNDMYDYADIQPILLNPQILERNGFYWGYTSNEYDIASNTIVSLDEDDKGWVWDEGGGAVKIQFPTNSDGGVIVADDQSFDRFLTLHFCNDIYVHELQHILKLCKINKEIVL